MLEPGGALPPASGLELLRPAFWLEYGGAEIEKPTMVGMADMSSSMRGNREELVELVELEIEAERCRDTRVSIVIRSLCKVRRQV